MLAVSMGSAACGGHKEKSGPAPEVPDTTQRVVLLGRAGTDSLRVRLLADSTERTYTLRAAVAAKAVFGRLSTGDTLAVVAAPDGRDLRSVVNVGQIPGFWLFDGEDGNGMRLLPDGAAENVGTAEVGLRSWRLKNGQLLITYIPADGSRLQEQTDTSELRLLSDSVLSLTLRGRAYVCRRHSGLITAR